jgi:hypothetical protein
LEKKRWRESSLHAILKLAFCVGCPSPKQNHVLDQGGKILYGEVDVEFFFFKKKILVKTRN